MGKQIFAAILLIAIIVGGYYGYKKYQENKIAASGEVVCKVNCDTPEEKARFDLENHGETADGQSEHKQNTSRESAAIIAQGGNPAGTPDGFAPGPSTGSGGSGYNPPAPPAGAVSNQPLPAGAYSPNGPAPQGAFPPTPPTGQVGQTTGYAPMASTAVRYPAGLPMSDSQTGNAPNGARFGANGTYQWYRQGNLTWRVNSQTGSSCIDFATMEEWRKQIVMQNGCGRSA